MSNDGQTLTDAGPFIDAGAGTPDGFRPDVEGNLWCGWGMGSDEVAHGAGPTRLVVAFPAGGPADSLARVLAITPALYPKLT